MSIAGQKIWEDQDNASGIRPDEVTVRLIRNGTVIAEATVTANNGWQYRFDDLPFYDPQGVPYAYAVSESPVPGYYARVDGYDLINRLVPDEPAPSDPPVKNPPSEEELIWKLYLPNHEPRQYGKLLKTGLELPAYPFVFAGIGCAALITLRATKRKRRKK